MKKSRGIPPLGKGAFDYGKSYYCLGQPRERKKYVFLHSGKSPDPRQAESDHHQCFALIAAGLLTLFGVRPGDFIDALFRSQRKSATLTDELNVLMGTPAKGFFNQDFELKQILKGTGRADRYEAVKRLSLILFAVGGALALLIGNVYMVPILGIGFSLAPIWYLRSTAASYKKHLNEELETAISIITTSYLRTEDLMDEALREIDGNPVSLTSWNAVLPFVLRGEIPPSDSPCQDTNASAGPMQTGEIHNSSQTV